LHTIVRLLLKEFSFSIKSSLSTQSVCHTISPRVPLGLKDLLTVLQPNKDSTSLRMICTYAQV